MQSVLDRYSHNQKSSFPAGSILLAEGQNSGKLYVLVEGTVEVLRGQVPLAVVNDPGAVFGEMSVLLGLPHTATVRTQTPVTAYAFDNAAAFMRSDPDIAILIARMLAQRLNLVNTYLIDLKRQYAGYGNHLGMVSEVLASLVNQQADDFTPGSDRQPDPAM